MKVDSNSKKARIYVMLFTEAVYAIWNKRNSKIFQNHFLQPRQVIKDVIFKVAARCKDDDKTMLFT